MKTFNRIISLLMVALMLATSVPYTVFTASAADDGTENYTLTLGSNPVDSFTAENSVEGTVAFFSRNEFDGSYGNQLDGVARELYDSLVKNYATDKKTGEYTHVFETPYTFTAEIAGGSIVMNDELEEIQLELDYAIQIAMDAFLYDHPEVFWLKIIESYYSISASGNSVNGYTGYIRDITIVPTEIYSGASSKASQYDSAVESVLSAITVTESRYDTLKSIHDYICENAWYNLVDEQKVHSSEPFFIGDGGVVCEGYAKTFKVICDRLEIPCVLVSGYAGGAHMWNYVQMDDGKWYLVDATWDDQERQIYDTYFLANANTIGFGDVAISEERTERTDFSGTGIFSFTYPVLSTTAYTIHIHEWDTEYTVDVEPTCTEKGSKSIHCIVDGCNATKGTTEIDISNVHKYENFICSLCGIYDADNLISYGDCGDSVYYTLDNDGNMRIFGEGDINDYDYGSLFRSKGILQLIKIVVIESGVTSIGDWFFSECYNLTSITIPDTVVDIGDYALYHCYSLTSIIIPKSVKNIGYDAFSSCDSIEAFVVALDNEFYSNNDDGVLFNKDKTELIQYPIGSERTSYSIPETVIRIGNNAFSWCENLESVSIPNTVTGIGDYAFCRCYNLKEILIPNSVVSIGNAAFMDCDDFVSVIIPPNVKILGYEAFYNCDNLKNVTIEEGLETIQWCTFQYCISLENIIIPNSIKNIEYDTFEYCSNLKIVHYLGSYSDWSKINRGSGNSYFINASRHYCTEIDTIDAICTSDGNEVGWYCNDCEKYIIGGKPISKLGHSFDTEYTIDKAPTCTTKGSKSRHCLREGCYTQTDFTVIPATNHPNKREYAQQDATCTEIGYTVGIHCPDCNTWIEGHEEISSLDHNWNDGVINPVSTCKTHGTKTYTCLNDASHKKTEQVALDGSNHEGGTYVVGKIDATYVEEGYTGDTYCSGCNEKIASGEVIPEVTVPDFIDVYPEETIKVTLKAGSSLQFRVHSFADHNETFYSYYISGTSRVEMKWIDEETGEVPEGGGDGSVLSFNNEKGKTYIITIKSKVSVDKVISFYMKSHTHNLKFNTTVYPNCTDSGYDLYKCSCGLEKQENYVSSIGHNWDEGIIDIVPTCNTRGIKRYTCLNDESHVKEIDLGLDKSNHIGETYFVGPIEATCISDGYTGDIYCFACYEEISKGETIDALGHNEESHEAKAPTCTEIGWDAYVTCSRCDYTTYAEKAVLGHKESEAVKENEVSATCTAIGSYDMVVYCSVCGEELSRETEIVSATGHSYETAVTAPACEEDGYTTYTCICGDTYISDEIAAIGHNYVNNTTPATLTSNGKIESKCSACGDVESSQTITKIGSVTLSAEKYVHDSKNKTPKVTVKDADGNTLVKNVDYKTSVASKRSGIGKYTVKVTFIGNYEGSKNVYFTILPGKPATIKAASQTTSSIELSWSAVSGAAGYTIYRYSPSKKAYVKAGTTEGTRFTVNGLYSATEYTFKVVAYGKTSGGKVSDSESYALLNSGTMPGKPSSVKSASQTTSSVKLSWSAVTRATGYNVYRYSPSKKAYVKAGSTTGTSYTVKSLYDGTKYTFRVVPYFKTSDGTIIESSSYALLKTATKTNTPTLSKVVSSAKGKATLTWANVDGETGYTVYYSTKKDSGFTKYANYKADSKSGNVTGLTSGKTYYFKVRTYITTDSGYVYSAWSTVKNVKVK